MSQLDYSKLKLGPEDMQNIRDAIEYLMEIRGNLRQFSPDFTNIPAPMQKTLGKLVKKTAGNLIPLFEQLGLCNLPTMNEDTSNSEELLGSGVELLERVGSHYVFIGSNSIKKKLKSLGIEPFKIISAGGPLTIEEVKALNPKIPEKALQGIQKRIDNVFDEISKAFANQETIYFIQGLDEENDQMLADQLQMVEKKTDGTFSRLKINSWGNL